MPWLIQALIFWRQGGAIFLEMYGKLIFIPVILFSLGAAANLSPRLNFSAFIKLLVGGVFLLGALIVFSSIFIAIFFEPYIPVYPSRDEWLAFLDFFWFAFLAAWYLWSASIRLREKLPLSIRKFITTINSYHPDLNFIILSCYLFLSYPFFIALTEEQYNNVVSTLGVWLQFTEFDKIAWLYAVSLIPITLAIGLLLFLGFATIKFISQPTIAKKITPSFPVSGFIAVLWLFFLWWIFFSSITTFVNFLFPGEYVLATMELQPPTFIDFFFYVFGELTPKDFGDIRATGNVARWISIWMTITGYLMSGLLLEVILINFSKKLSDYNSQQKPQ